MLGDFYIKIHPETLNYGPLRICEEQQQQRRNPFTVSLSEVFKKAVEYKSTLTLSDSNSVFLECKDGDSWSLNGNHNKLQHPKLQ